MPLLSCFPCYSRFQVPELHDDPPARQARPQPSAPPCPPGFQPNQRYSVKDFSNMLRDGRYQAEQRPALFQQMANMLDGNLLEAQDRLTLIELLAKHLNQNEGVQCRGATRQANFFAGYGVELMFKSLDSAYNPQLEQSLRALLNLWIHELVPTQTEFNIDGVVYSRAEIQDMLSQGRFYPIHSASQEMKLKSDLEGVMRTRVGSAQTVHNVHVREAGSQVMARLRACQGRTPLPTANQAMDALYPYREQVHMGYLEKNIAYSTLANLSLDETTDTCWNVVTSPSEVVKLLSLYINHPNREALRIPLMESLLTRAYEIHQEDPCITGRIQRLLDVGSGIDPHLSGDALQGQMREDLIRIAAKVNEQFTAMAEEDAQRARRDGLTQKDAIVSGVGRDLFRHRAVVDMSRTRGFGEIELEPDLSRLEAGF